MHALRVLVAFVLVGAFANAATAQPYLEVNGRVVVEIESQPSNGWTAKTATPGYTGSSYYRWEGQNWFYPACNTNAECGGHSTLTYEIQIQNPGNYQLMFHGLLGVTSPPVNEANDTFLMMSGQPIAGEPPLLTNTWRKIYQNQLGWSWHSRTELTSSSDGQPAPIRQFFSAGLHTIKFSARSTNHSIDRFVLFKYEDYPYEGPNNLNGQLSDAAAGQASVLKALPVSTTAAVSEELVCVRAGDADSLAGTMTTGDQFTDGADLDALADNLTKPLLFANSATNDLSGNSADRATYFVDLPSAGAWYLWGRFYYPGAPGSNDANSFAAAIDGGTSLKLGNKRDKFQKWHWDGNGVTETGTVSGLPLGTLAAGPHTLSVRKREVVTNAPRVDVLCFSKNRTAAPTDAAVCDQLGGCSTAPPPAIVCAAAGNPTTLGGNMTTNAVFTSGADQDPAADNLTTPLLFANSTVDDLTGSGADQATYVFNVPTTGQWYLWGRFYYPNTPGSNEANSFLARIDGKPLQKFGNKRDKFLTWHWDGNGAPEQGAVSGLSLGSVSAGSHTVTIKKREVRPTPPRIDVVCITQEPTAPPVDEEVCLLFGGC